MTFFNSYLRSIFCKEIVEASKDFNSRKIKL